MVDEWSDLRALVADELMPEASEARDELAKQQIRAAHRPQRQDRHRATFEALRSDFEELLSAFADGKEVDPVAISPKLVPVASDTYEAKVFRMATLWWSIPVSQGFGRRMRFLVVDQANGKLIGIAALGDPVFNLRVRDDAIEWDAKERGERLVNLLDAYVLGAVPPYNELLCGKLVAAMLVSQDVRDLFSEKYGHRRGVISGRKKFPELVALTTTSALGRSSVYNRLKLNGKLLFRSIGFTQGYGHFHVSETLFRELRGFLRDRNHTYADGNRFGQGPNWRFRVVRAALSALGMDRDLLRHGVRREVFLAPLADNAIAFLRDETPVPVWNSLISAEELAAAAVERWIRPRAARRSEYKEWSRQDLRKRLVRH